MESVGQINRQSGLRRNPRLEPVARSRHCSAMQRRLAMTCLTSDVAPPNRSRQGATPFARHDGTAGARLRGGLLGSTVACIADSPRPPPGSARLMQLPIGQSSDSIDSRHADEESLDRLSRAVDDELRETARRQPVGARARGFAGQNRPPSPGVPEVDGARDGDGAESGVFHGAGWALDT